MPRIRITDSTAVYSSPWWKMLAVPAITRHCVLQAANTFQASICSGHRSTPPASRWRSSISSPNAAASLSSD